MINMGKIDFEEITVDQMRKFKGVKLPDDMNKIINVNTYYRIINNTNKFNTQNRVLIKLAKGFGISVEVLKKQIENQNKTSK